MNPKMIEALRSAPQYKVEIDKPLVSFIICTFGRIARQPELLNEAVWWANNQGYPNVEVLVLNDAPKQKLRINPQLYPRVRIVNWPERCPDLGTKYNLAVALSAGEICCWCEDDDISLPWRANQAVHYLQNHDYWPPRLWIYANKGMPCVVDGNGCGHSSAAFRRTALLGRFTPSFANVDQHIMAFALQNLRVNKRDIIREPKKISYVYRWGVSQMHLSGASDAKAAYENLWPGKDGEYEIQPCRPVDWVGEYDVAVRRYLEDGSC